MFRSILRTKRGKCAEDAAAKTLNELVRACPRCRLPLKGHEYRLVAATSLKPNELDSFRDLLSAIRNHDWQKVISYQQWEGKQANAEVYGLKCPDGALSVIVISAPFALEEPYTLMHQELADDIAVLSTLPDYDTWHRL